MKPWQQTLLALLPVVVAGGWWLLRRAQREDVQRELDDLKREAAEAERTETKTDDEIVAMKREALRRELEDLSGKDP